MINGICKKIILPFFVLCMYLFLYVPIIVLVVFSFNKVAFPYKWVGFTFHWYQELFQSVEILQATKNSLIIALSSACITLTLALGWIFYSRFYQLRAFKNIFLLSVIVPEIILALGLLSIFTFFSVPLDLYTLIAGHTMLGLAYAVPIISEQFYELDYSIIEASQDLGATLGQTFFKVILPNLFSGLFASGLLVFVLSLDDFLISFFCSGGNAQTLSLYIFATIRSGVSPSINALSTILLLASSVLILMVSLLNVRTKIF